MKVKLSGQAAYYTQYHLTWITKHRHRILNPGVASYLIKLFPKLISVVWSPGYFVSTVGINEQQIRKYIKFQQSQDSGQAKLVLG